MQSTDSPHDAMALLKTYVRDHDAASAGGEALARRCAGSNEGNDLGVYLKETLLPQIEAEQRTLRAALETLDARPSAAKRAAARSGELVGRLKPNRRMLSYSPMSRVLELEGLIAGVHAKHRLWITLDALRTRHAMESLPDVEEHASVAQEQMVTLERHHLDAISQAFAPPPEPASEEAPGDRRITPRP
jgi:hypothetical protein